jgi:hypothetical protein
LTHYSVAFAVILVRRYLTTRPIDQQPQPCADGDGYQLHTWDSTALKEAVTEWHDEWGLASEAADGGNMTAEERAMAHGPPLTYIKHQDIFIGDQRFVVTCASLNEGPALRDSSIMRGKLDQQGRMFFGVLREIRLFQPFGEDDATSDSHTAHLATYTAPVLLVDWIAHGTVSHRRMHVPVVNAATMTDAAVASYFPAKRFCSPQHVIPTWCVLALYPQGHGKSGSAKFDDSRYCVLHRDANLPELAQLVFSSGHSVR